MSAPGRVAAALAAAAVALAGCGLPANGVSAFGVHLAGPRGYVTRGNRILGPDGRPFAVHGVDRPSLEWSPTGDHLSAADFRHMAAWGANTVRIALDQDFWLSTSCRYAPAYRATVEQAVAWAEAAGLVVILDLHWSDQGQDQTGPGPCAVAPGQQPMADGNSLTFWRQVASVYRRDPRVWLELYNEPHDVSWAVWRNGGTVTDAKTGRRWTAMGMQQLYDAVRAAGARNIVVVGGLNWAYDLRGLPHYALSGYNIVYAVHPYDYPGKQPADWPVDFGFAAKTWPLVATEFGQFDCGTAYVAAFLRYAAANGIGWTAWAWYPGGCGFPSIIRDWQGDPSAMGVPIQAAMRQAAGR